LQLFDFDLEVEPVLDVLVGKTVEQALIEVLEEEELEVLRVQQRRFRELRAREKAEQQPLEKQDERLHEEKVTKAPQHPAFRFPSLQSRSRV
jgi:predicted RNase H-like nuclease (RuvC/YqgF family)